MKMIRWPLIGKVRALRPASAPDTKLPPSAATPLDDVPAMAVTPTSGVSLRVVIILGAAVMLSALAVIRVKHHNRLLTTELNRSLVERQRLDREWSQLTLEQSSLSQSARIEQIAKDQLGMEEPHKYVIVEQKP